ncbi:MAG: hypothetical protein AB1758_33730, partial [Candidatus Eremiobacterota bacterium]
MLVSVGGPSPMVDFRRAQPAGQQPAAQGPVRQAGSSVAPEVFLAGIPPLGLNRFPMLATEKVRDLTLQSPVFPDGPLFLAAGSGTVRVDDCLYVLPDDGLHLARFPDDGPGRLERLLDRPDLPTDEDERKKVKPDMEALTATPDRTALVAFGSGSTERREQGVLYPLDGSKPMEFALSTLYAAIRARLSGLDPRNPRLNLEGSAFVRDAVVLAQRGNSLHGVNALVELDAAGFLQAVNQGSPPGAGLIRTVTQVDLGSLGS